MNIRPAKPNVVVLPRLILQFGNVNCNIRHDFTTDLKKVREISENQSMYVTQNRISVDTMSLDEVANV